MVCKRCRYQNSMGAKYCAGCGKRLSESGGRNWLWTSIIAVLAVAVLVSALLFKREDNVVCDLPAEDHQTIAESTVAPVQETTAAFDPLVLAYYEKTDSAPAQYYYNEAGQLVRNVQEQWNQVTNYEYHANGAMKTETVIRDGSIYYVTEFDDHGNPLAEYSAGELFYSYTNQYDDQDRLVLCTKTVEGERKDIYQYTYDENGWYDQDYTYITIWNGEELVHDQVWRRYSPVGVLVHESWTVKDYLPISIGTIYTSDDHGNVVMESYQYWSDTERKRDDTYYEHTYDAKGFVTKTEVSYAGFYMDLEHMDDPNAHYNSEIPLKEVITYTYDAEGRMTGKNIQNVEHGFTTENVWEYDETGNLIRFYGVPEEEPTGYTEEIWQYKPLSEVLYSGQ